MTWWAHFIGSRARLPVNEEFVWIVLLKILITISVVARYKPADNDFGFTVSPNGAATVKLSKFETECGYTSEVHAFLFARGRKDMRNLLTSEGNICFGSEKNAPLRTMTVQTKENISTVPFPQLREWLASCTAVTAAAAATTSAALTNAVPITATNPVTDPAPPAAVTPVAPAAPAAAAAAAADFAAVAPVTTRPKKEILAAFESCSFNRAEKAIILNQLLGMCSTENFITRRAGNGSSQRWMRVVSMRPGKELQHWENFLRDISDSTLGEYCEMIGGSEEHGVRLLAHRLMKIDRVSTMRGVRDGGGVIMEEMDAEATAGLFTYCRLDVSQRRDLAAVLKFHNGGRNPVLAGEILMKNVKAKHLLAYRFLTVELDEHREHAAYDPDVKIRAYAGCRTLRRHRMGWIRK
jgi:hypothetical protein